MHLLLEFTSFKLGPDSRETGEKMADQFMAGMKSQPGFIRATFFADLESGEFGALSIWKSMQALEAAHAALGPKLQEMVSGMLQAPPVFKQFEVYEPKAG